MPTEDLLSELVASGIMSLVQEIRVRFTSSLVSVSCAFPHQTSHPCLWPPQVALSPSARDKVYVEVTWTAVCSF